MMLNNSALKSTSEMSYEEPVKPFDAWDPHVTRRIDALVKLAKTGTRPPSEEVSDLVREMIVTALKTESAGLDRGDGKILSRALRELRYGFHIFQPYRNRRKVTIFGSARTLPSHREYKMARQFSAKMATQGFMVITGAGPGIMQAGNEGAGKNNSFGVNIRLPFEQKPNQFISQDTLFIDCRFFFTRKLMFLKETSAVVLFPGGFGTHDEAMEVLTLVQTGKCDPIPVVLLEAPGNSYWSDWRRYVVKHFLKPGKISPEDMHLFKVTNSVSEAVEEMTHFYHNYHSLRYVKENLVIRLTRPPSKEGLLGLNRNFRDICVAGATIQLTGPLPEEQDHRELPRLVFKFNRFNFGRLRQMIDTINAD
jgi:uncharacterized protein (TIGR00730 family)